MLGFDELGGTIDEYFKIYRLRLKERLDEFEAPLMIEYLFNKVDAGVSAY